VQSVQGAADLLGPDVARTVEQLRATSENLARLSARVDTLMAQNSTGLQQFTQEGLPQLQQTLRSAQQAADELSALSRRLEEEPSQLLYERRPSGVELPQ
jgi:phospholipid/cholesterol/gamma-HCH transport system substrate-binding protein